MPALRARRVPTARKDPLVPKVRPARLALPAPRAIRAILDRRVRKDCKASRDSKGMQVTPDPKVSRAYPELTVLTVQPELPDPPVLRVYRAILVQMELMELSALLVILARRDHKAT